MTQKKSRSRTKKSFGAGSRSCGLSADMRNKLSDFDGTSGDISSEAAKRYNEKFRKRAKPGFLLI